MEIAGAVLAAIFFGSFMLISKRIRKQPCGANEKACPLNALEQDRLSLEPECICTPCKTLEILYQNQKGQMTIRDIDVIRVYQEKQHWYVDAFCHLLNEQCIFEVEKIKCLKCPKHCSRLINSVEILEYLTKHLE
ncbi:hypothetical protein E0H82_11875 [Acinetobacter sp. ANC 4910]|uniref:WYL domain-containing protein n=1 Tax=Acinetobacter sp. ANC 4910 TaxID=2529850 RepID=UPI00103A0879|nr:WYL domain-containing protein [Acinetobacter sp. ANC 4910]TCB34086.1 hypothetical protein E0H82_11875 [Acinetobacter sp. ANC 4910]